MLLNNEVEACYISHDLKTNKSNFHKNKLNSKKVCHYTLRN